MRAVVTEDFGSAPVVSEVETPEPGPGEIRVKVRSSSVNGFDAAIAGGFLKGVLDHRFPVVLGKDFAGSVDSIGEGVTRFSPGENVLGVVLTQPLSAGAFGDYVVVPEAPNVARIPDGLDYATAGALGLAGSAAVGSIEAVALGPGETVLVAGATGGVGAFAMQLATARGARVIATAAGAVEAEHVRRLGAAHVVDHRGDLAEQVRAVAPSGVDAVLHFAGDPLALAGLLAEGGRFASLLMMTPDQFRDDIPVATAVYAAPEAELLRTLAGEVSAGRLVVPIQRSYALAEVPQAFADFAAGTLGKLGITVA